MLLPALAQARERARQTACMNNLKQIGIICTMYATDYEGFLPGGHVNNSGPKWYEILSSYIPSPLSRWNYQTYTEAYPAVFGNKLLLCPSASKIGGNVFTTYAPILGRTYESGPWDPYDIYAAGGWKNDAKENFLAKDSQIKYPVDTPYWVEIENEDFMHSFNVTITSVTMPDMRHTGGTNVLFAGGNVRYVLRERFLEPFPANFPRYDIYTSKQTW